MLGWALAGCGLGFRWCLCGFWVPKPHPNLTQIHPSPTETPPKSHPHPPQNHLNHPTLGGQHLPQVGWGFGWVLVALGRWAWQSPRRPRASPTQAPPKPHPTPPLPHPNPTQIPPTPTQNHQHLTQTLWGQHLPQVGWGVGGVEGVGWLWIVGHGRAQGDLEPRPTSPLSNLTQHTPNRTQTSPNPTKTPAKPPPKSHPHPPRNHLTITQPLGGNTPSGWLGFGGLGWVWVTFGWGLAGVGVEFGWGWVMFGWGSGGVWARVGWGLGGV